VSGWSVSRLDEIPLTDDGRAPWRAVRHELGIGAFGINAFVGRGSGERVINEHDETDTGEEELYVVVSGHALFTIDDDEVDAPAGKLVFVKPAARRGAVAKEAETTVLAIGATPGEPYRPSGWELWAPAAQLFQAGEYERVIQILEPLVEEHPDYAALVYNLACAESLAGRRDAAIAHARQAIELDDHLRKLARTDTDLDAIRDEPAFVEAVAEGG
jgi:tetratricopeptide (TPR) repeat protein